MPLIWVKCVTYLVEDYLVTSFMIVSLYFTDPKVNTTEFPSTSSASVEIAAKPSKELLSPIDQGGTHEGQRKSGAKGDFSIVGETTSNFLNQLRGISMARTLEEVVRKSLNENDSESVRKLIENTKDLKRPTNS